VSGHSKWATTKHKKAIIDSRRAKNFAKLIKAIEVSARAGGADVSGNPTLYDAIAKAKKNSVPSDNMALGLKLVANNGKQLCMKGMQQEALPC
jgi:transcriptional/translational regulatory protein YebC/TACO1